MDKDPVNSPTDAQSQAPVEPPSVSADIAPPPTVDLDAWVLTPAQRAFIQSLLNDDDSEPQD